MLHRYEDAIISPIEMDVDIASGKVMLLKHYGFQSEELIRDPLNFFIKYWQYIPEVLDSVIVANLVKQLDEYSNDALFARYEDILPKVFNKIPLANLANAYYEIWALIITRYRLTLSRYLNQLLHVLLCEGVPYPTIQITDVASNAGTDPLLNAMYIVIRITVLIGE